jgi:hypothetical protein
MTLLSVVRMLVEDAGHFTRSETRWIYPHVLARSADILTRAGQPAVSVLGAIIVASQLGLAHRLVWS